MIAAALDAYAAASQRQFIQDRSQTVGASEVGRCARQTFFSKNHGDTVYGVKRDTDHFDGWGARTRGSVFEDAFWAPAMQAFYGDKALFVGSAQRTFIDGFLSGTPDGLLVDQPADALAHLGVADIEGDSVLLDAKSVDPRTRFEGAKPEHQFQVISNMGLVRKLTPYRPGYAIVSYTDASFWDQTREPVVRFDEAVYAEAKRRASDIMLARSADELRPEGVIAGGKECELCSFRQACGQARYGYVPKEEAAIPEDQAINVVALARSIDQLKRDAREVEREITAYEDTLREMLKGYGTRLVNHGGVRVAWFGKKGRASTLNKGLKEAAVAAGIDVSQFERIGAPSDGIEITLSEIPSTASAGRVPAASAVS